MKLDKQNRLVLTPEAWELIGHVHKTVNQIKYETDQALFGTPDFWTQWADKNKAGDCDDYTLTKRRILIEKGMPYECLSPAACLLDGVGHLVLIVRTDKGGYVLCNNLAQVRPWKGLKVHGKSYEWLAWHDPITKKWIAFKTEE